MSTDERPSARGLRWILGWIVLPLAALMLLFAAGVHVGARRPDKPLARAMLWAFEGEAGVASSERGTRAFGTTPSAGGWIVGDYEVVIDAPSDLRLESYGRHFGVVLRVDHEGDGAELRSRIEINDQCAGSCNYAEFEDRLLDEYPNAQFEGRRTSRAVPVARVEWVQRPKKDWSGRYWWRTQSFDESGGLVRDDTTVAWSPPGIDHFLECEVELSAPYFDRANELIDVCKQLEWRVLGDRRPAMEARFGGRYEVGGLTLTMFEPPVGYEFEKYEPGRAVAFGASGFGSLSSVTIVSLCLGGCDPASFRGKIVAGYKDDLDREADHEVVVVHPLEEVAPNRLRSRLEHAHKLLEGRVAAIRPGANTWLECNFDLWDDQRERADEFEALCLELLEGW